ncbi:MAG: hypothetical protein A2Y58_00755 [Chloroflexi bacterium RBG_13_51_52]|nr:MAG: hypothetical protein A2Y58_00755 [Chloroflexi bacterium RBG_13_51_52]
MFHSARWKAYLQNLQDNVEGDVENINSLDNIYSIFHSQKVWFAIEKKNDHQKVAEEHLKRSDALINDCTKKVNALEEILANTPKPSEMLDWNNVTLQDLA